MAKVHYNFLISHAYSLDMKMDMLNRNQDKIIAVTQNGNVYTIFYEQKGNANGEGE